MVGENWFDIRGSPKSAYEYAERCGILPKLPPGYTYAPHVIPFATTKKDKSTESAPLDQFIVPKNSSTWKTADEIPKEFSKNPPKQELDFHGSNCPPGFNIVCTYPGFDPDKVDRSPYILSPIYGKPLFSKASMGKAIPDKKDQNGTSVVMQTDRVHYQDYSTVAGIEDLEKSLTVPQSTTINRHPILFPCKIPYLFTNIGC
jgi:hypothetical protein